MSKHISPSYFYQLCRLVTRSILVGLFIKDGTLMWKHALLYQNKSINCQCLKHTKQHIIKTAQRLEELNTWVSNDLDPWDSSVAYCFGMFLSNRFSWRYRCLFSNTLDILIHLIVYDWARNHPRSRTLESLRDKYLYFRADRPLTGGYIMILAWKSISRLRYHWAFFKSCSGLSLNHTRSMYLTTCACNIPALHWQVHLDCFFNDVNSFLTLPFV